MDFIAGDSFVPAFDFQTILNPLSATVLIIQKTNIEMLSVRKKMNCAL